MIIMFINLFLRGGAGSVAVQEQAAWHAGEGAARAGGVAVQAMQLGWAECYLIRIELPFFFFRTSI